MLKSLGISTFNSMLSIFFGGNNIEETFIRQKVNQ